MTTHAQFICKLNTNMQDIEEKNSRMSSKIKDLEDEKELMKEEISKLKKNGK